jgi:hypothetical protein
MKFLKSDDYAVLRAFLVWYGMLALAWIVTIAYTAYR